mgnify:CR=1 FL=1
MSAQVPNSSKMFDKLKKGFKVKEATVKSYYRNIKRLAKISGLAEIPESKNWLTAEKGRALIRKIKKYFPITVSRHLYTAGVVALRAAFRRRWQGPGNS